MPVIRQGSYVAIALLAIADAHCFVIVEIGDAFADVQRVLLCNETQTRCIAFKFACQRERRCYAVYHIPCNDVWRVIGARPWRVEREPQPQFVDVHLEHCSWIDIPFASVADSFFDEATGAYPTVVADVYAVHDAFNVKLYDMCWYPETVVAWHGTVEEVRPRLHVVGVDKPGDYAMIVYPSAFDRREYSAKLVVEAIVDNQRVEWTYDAKVYLAVLIG